MTTIRQRMAAIGCALALGLAACGEGREAQISPPQGTAGPGNAGDATGGPGPGDGTQAPTVPVAVPNDGGNVEIPTIDPQETPSMVTSGTPTP